MSRKYKQRGYQDEGGGGDKKGRGRTGGKKGQMQRAERQGPRGRGMGAPTRTVFKCAACGKEIYIKDSVAVDATCPHCETDLHTCTHCRHFDTNVAFECRKEIPKRISKKATRNDCDLFEPRMAQDFEREIRDPEQARSAFDALFDL